MAAKASKERVQADMRPPDYRKAVQIVRGTYQVKKQKIAGINGEIADMWAKVEGLKVNKKGAKIWAALDQLDHDDRMDAFRTINALADVSEWDKQHQDLADAADGNVVPLRFGQGGEEASADGVGDQEFDQQVEDAIAAAADPDPHDEVARRKAQLKGLDAARDHLAGKGGDAPEPYTGDNSDLAGGDQ